ncbi:synaptotagmin-4 [Conger conger]|uniref:synaptotagmin-4 n=1 Tax=Conger conger TaxID=82655 RepID=UPI002A59FCF5|nr:synaptotagmin-4 [Conger conger]
MAPVVAEQAQFAELPVAVGVVSVFGLVFSVSLFSWICCQRKNAKSAKTPPYRFVHMLKGVDIYPEGLSGKRKFGASEAKGDAHHAKATPSPTGTRPALHLDLNGNFSKPAHPAPKVRSSPDLHPSSPHPGPGTPESALSTPAPTPAEKPQDREGGLGRLFFSLEYNLEKKAFVVHIQEAQGLCATDDQSLTSDPYIKLTILPEKKHKVKTRVLRKTLDPAFQETFSFYGIPFARLPQLALHFMVLSFDRFSRDEVIGETLVPLSGIDLSEGRVRMHRDIIKRNQKRSTGRGELLLSLCYQSTTSTLTVVVLKARHLPKTESSGPSDPYVKLNLYQGAKRVCKKKTHVKKCSPNPVFNELFVFDVPWEEGLRQTSVELLLLDSPSPAASPAPVLGRLLLAASAPGTPGEHWREICDHPRRQIAKWHALSED